MALTELQKPDKTTLYNHVQRVADEMYRHMESWEAASKFIAALETADFDAMGVPDGDIRTHIGDLQQVITEVRKLSAGETVTPVKPAVEVIEKLRRMMPI